MYKESIFNTIFSVGFFQRLQQLESCKAAKLKKSGVKKINTTRNLREPTDTHSYMFVLLFFCITVLYCLLVGEFVMWGVVSFCEIC